MAQWRAPSRPPWLPGGPRCPGWDDRRSWLHPTEQVGSVPFLAIDEPVDSDVVMIESTAPGTQSVNRPLLTPRMELSIPAVAQGLRAAGSGCPSGCTCTQPSGSSLGPRL